MLTLGGMGAALHNLSEDEPTFITRLSTNPALPRPLRAPEAFLVHGNAAPDGFGLYVLIEDGGGSLTDLPAGARAIVVPAAYDYLGDGDVLRVVPRRGALRVLYRKAANVNSFLTTERCNNYCLMCSQPPKDIDDGWIVEEILQALPLIDPQTREIGLSGGEPTLLGDDLIRILRACRSWLPHTAIHMLSNGRRFADPAFAQAYAAVDHPDLMVGIPLYSDLANIHDYVVQAEGAFDETIRGILNLKRLGQRVEIRVVIHRQTYGRLPQLAEFLARNLLFVDHVALMGLEITGFTRANLDTLWIDPYDYQRELHEATRVLAAYRMHVSIYNHQLCLLPEELWPYARRSISDWKNEYMPECEGCLQRARCGGFFSSAKLRYSGHIAPFREVALTHASGPS
jgi:His-Xaa-Ser system radical SAM maturase HxsC